MRIRDVTVADAAAIRAIYAPVVERTTISFEEVPPTVEEIAGRIAATLPACPWIIAENDGAIAGYAYAGPHRTRAAYRTSVDVAVYVAEGARGQGIGRALYEVLLPEAGRCGFHAAFAGITLPNPASIGLHEAMGFEPVGVYREVGRKFDRWLDVGWWQRLL